MSSEIIAAPGITGIGSTYDKDKVKKEIDEYNEIFKDDKDEKKRKENYTTVVLNFYHLVTDFYEYGWGESFHFAPRHQLESFAQSIARYEHYIALRLGLKPGMKVLDVGCGIGGPMREIARFSGANVIGLNINEYQTQRAKFYNKKYGLDDKLTYLQGDFMKIPSEGNAFDAVYAIEATCHAPDKVGCYAEIYRILKPGQYFAAYDWCMTEKYDPKNAEHNKIKHDIELGNGLPEIVYTKDVDAALKKVGFEIIELTDFGLKTPQNPIQWYETLAGGWSISNFRYTQVGRWLTDKMVATLEWAKVAPKGSSDTSRMLVMTADALVKGGRTGIFTPSYFFLVRKPLNA